MYAERENTSRISSTTHVCTIRIQYLFVCLDGWIDVMLDGQQQHQANIGPVLSIFFSLLSSLYDEYTKHFHYITLQRIRISKKRTQFTYTHSMRL